MSDGATPSEAAQTFSPPVVGLMALAGVFAFCALVVLMAYAPDLKSGDDGQTHALSKSAVGFAGLMEALRLSGEPAVVNRAAIPTGRGEGLLIVTPTPLTNREAIEALSFDGPVLVILPKWGTSADPRRLGWVRRVDIIDPAWLPPDAMLRVADVRRRSGVSAPRLHGAGGPFAGTDTLSVGSTESWQTIGAKGAEWAPILTDDTGGVVLARLGGKPVYVLADPDLVNTQGLRSDATFGAALTILRALRDADGPFLFDVRLNGLGRERSVLRLLFDPPFLAMTLCLAAGAALAAVQAFGRFGPVRAGGRAIALGKAALVDNTAALIRLAGRERAMGGRYADLTGEATARAAGAPRGLAGEALTRLLDALSAQKRLPEPFSELAFRARTAPTAHDMARAAGRLFEWRTAMTAASPSLTRAVEAGSLATAPQRRPPSSKLQTDENSP